MIYFANRQVNAQDKTFLVQLPLVVLIATSRGPRRSHDASKDLPALQSASLPSSTFSLKVMKCASSSTAVRSFCSWRRAESRRVYFMNTAGAVSFDESLNLPLQLSVALVILSQLGTIMEATEMNHFGRLSSSDPPDFHFLTSLSRPNSALRSLTLLLLHLDLPVSLIFLLSPRSRYPLLLSDP